MATFVKFPGTAGNYVSTDDVNLLDADTAHCQQAAGAAASYGAVANIGISDDLAPMFGSNHGVANPSGSVATSTVGLGTTTSFAVAGSTEYSFIMSVGSDQPDMEYQVLLSQRDSGGGNLGNVTAQAWKPLIAGQWDTPSVTWTTGATTAFVVPLIYYRAAAENLAGTDKLYWDAACIRPGPDATFVPSIRIVSDLDVRLEFALDDYTPAANNYLMSTSAANKGFGLINLTSGGLFFFYGNGSADVNAQYAPSFVDGTGYVLRVTRDASSGAVEWYVDNVSVDSDSTAAGNIAPSDQQLVVGATTAGGSLAKGDFYWAEVRDGIAGPVVARFDADDVPITAQLPA